MTINAISGATESSTPVITRLISRLVRKKQNYFSLDKNS